MQVAAASGAAWERRSRSRSLVLLAVALAGVAATAVNAWTISQSHVLSRPAEMAALDSAAIAVWVAAGMYVWWQRPDSRLGPLMAALGFVYAGYALSASGNDVVFTVGMVLWAANLLGTAYVLLCFPSGRLEPRLVRWFMAGYALCTAVLWVLILVLAPTLPRAESEIPCGTRCPANALQIVSGNAAAGKALETALNTVITIAAIGVAMLIFSKARSPSRLRRRTITPLAVSAIALMVEFVAAIYVLASYPGAAQAFVIANYAISVAIPLTMIMGLARGRAFAAKSLGRIAMGGRDTPRTPAAVEKVIGDAVGDPTLTLALWVPQRAGYLDVHGAPIDLPQPSDERAVTPITRDGSPVAALIYDPALDTDAEIVGGLAATSLMLLENTRLVEELRASRARIVETAERERMRLERDLHDGAQQRLMAIQVRLKMAERHAPDGPLAEELEAIRTDAGEAAEELRALAHGIYPGILRTRGLADALRSVAIGAPITIRIEDTGVGRAPEAIEAAIYFCAREAIQNAVKHAGPRVTVTVTLTRRGDNVEFAVADDGVGMALATHSDGVGLLSMRDRIGAVGGELAIVSSPRHGTIVRATVPERSEASSEAGVGGALDGRFVGREDARGDGAGTLMPPSGENEPVDDARASTITSGPRDQDPPGPGAPRI